MPTALTPPAGTFSVHNYELFFIGASYGVTDRLMLSVTALVPLFSGQGFVGVISGKAQIISTGRVRVAVQGAIATATADDGASIGGVGGVATLCITSPCSTHLSGYVGAAFAWDDQSSVPGIIGVSLLARLGGQLRLLLEAEAGYIAGDINDVSNGALVSYGLRFATQNVSADVAFTRPVCPDCDRDVFPIGFPVVSVTYRTN